MRTAVIGDIHGRDVWHTIIEKEAWNHIVFLGDYFDSFNIGPEKQASNFQDIVAYKRANPDKVTLLIGNHDFHYMPSNTVDFYSGYQRAYAHLFAKLLVDAEEDMQMAVENQGWLMTHAGVTEPWRKANGLSKEYLVDEINNLWLNKPDSFEFYPLDYRGYGEHPKQGPTWVRPNSLIANRARDKQIVGHTGQKEFATKEGELVFIDALPKWFVVIEDGNVSKMDV